MKACIVSIGNELLAGLTVDSNCAWLSRQLMGVGIATAGSYTVGDDVGDIAEAIGLAVSKGGIVIVTGGLGPTDDDLTREGLAEFLGAKLEFHEELLEEIKFFFDSRGIAMSEINRVQACLPKGCVAIGNRMGTAPGMMVEYEGTFIACLPGVPVEMKGMFKETVSAKVRRMCDGGKVVMSRKVRCFGTGESVIAEMLGDRMRRDRNPVINCTVDKGVITLHIVATAKNRQEAERMMGEDEKELVGILGDHVFGFGDDTMAQAVGAKLAANGKTISVAESCTGGLICKLLTDIAGSSEYFNRGWVTYSNESKIDELGVPAELIARYGAVSEEVARELAERARKKGCSDYAVSTTGIAGPGGGSDEKPVGLVYIGLSSVDGCVVEKRVFSHSRGYVRQRAAQTALNMVRLVIC